MYIHNYLSGSGADMNQLELEVCVRAPALVVRVRLWVFLPRCVYLVCSRKPPDLVSQWLQYIVTRLPQFLACHLGTTGMTLVLG